MPSLVSLLLPTSILGNLLRRNLEDLPEDDVEGKQLFDASESLGDFEASYEDDLE
jgi:hypothetical protein